MVALLADSILENRTLVICATVAIICIASEVAAYTVRWRKAELDADLKHEMIARGMSADEIERILAAKSSSGKKQVGSPPGTCL
jgi:hypothetical protein